MNANTEIKRDRNAEIRKHMFRNCNNFVQFNSTSNTIVHMAHGPQKRYVERE